MQCFQGQPSRKIDKWEETSSKYRLKFVMSINLVLSAGSYGLKLSLVLASVPPGRERKSGGGVSASIFILFLGK